MFFDPTRHRDGKSLAGINTQTNFLGGSGCRFRGEEVGGKGLTVGTVLGIIFFRVIVQI